MSSARLLFLILLWAFTAQAQTMETLANMPANLRESIEWVWQQRISPRSATAPIGEGSVARRNLITDQIYAANGSLQFVVRWQTTRNVSRAERQGIQVMLERHINNWLQHLVNYDNWPYGHIPVRVVGWAVANRAQIIDPQPDEIIYTDWSVEPINATDPAVPRELPNAPTTCSRFEHFRTANFTYPNCPGGPQNRFDMYLWATASWRGGVGGDWGQRLSENGVIGAINQNENTIISHEMGHGLGIVDFYAATERPPNGFPTRTIMWAGNSPTITEWDRWMLRYIWSQIRMESGRFPLRPPVGSSSSVQLSSSSVRSSSSSAPSSSSVSSSSSSAPSSSSVSSSSSSAPSSSSALVCASLVAFHNINAGAWVRDTNITLTAGDALIIGPQPVATSGWSWSGPGGFSASTREVRFSAITGAQAGTYTATYVAGTCQNSLRFRITVNPQAVVSLQGPIHGISPITPHLLVTDIRGKVLWNGPATNFQEVQSRLPQLPRGIYLVQSRKNGVVEKKAINQQ